MIAQLNKDYIKLRPWKLYSRFISYLFFEGRPLTTKGRWINPLIFKLFSFICLLPSKYKVKQPIFIVGTGRSGTTALGILLSFHKDIAYLNEPKAMWYHIYNYDDINGNYSDSQAKYILTENDATEIQSLKIKKLYSFYQTTTISKKVVDKYPEMIFRIPFIIKIFPDAKFIFIARNGWDTCHSIDKWSETNQQTNKTDKYNWWGKNDRKWKLLVEQVASTNEKFMGCLTDLAKIKNDKERAALEWVLTMQKGLSAIKQYPKNIKMVKFEKITNKPNETLTDIIQFCELRDDKKLFIYANKTLKNIPKRKTFTIKNQILKKEFHDTMTLLNYK